MKNRFENCNNIVDLQKVLGNNINFNSLTSNEIDKLVTVFRANALEADANYLELPLTEAGFKYICASVKETVINIASEELKEGNTMMNNIKNLKSDEAIKNAVNNATEKITDAVSNAKVKAGEDVEEFKNKCDDSITIIKDATCSVIEVIGNLTGCVTLKNDLYAVLYEDIANKSGKKGFYDGAVACRELINNRINGILEADPDEDDLKTVASLRYVIGEDEDGNPIEGHRSIFTAFARGIVWICKKVSRKFKSWFGADAESNVFGSVGASIASIFGVVAGVITSVLKVAVNLITFVGSYIISAVIHAISFVWDKLKSAGSFVKSKFSKDDEFEDEEYDNLFGEDEE